MTDLWLKSALNTTSKVVLKADFGQNFGLWVFFLGQKIKFCHSKLQIDERPLAKVSLEYNLGWKMAMSASAFALLGTFLNWIAAFIMFFIYAEDHENLTNAEKVRSMP